MEIRNTERDDRRGVVATDGENIWPRGIDTRVDGALGVRRARVAVDLYAVEPEFLEIVWCHELRAQRPRNEEMCRIEWTPRADVSKRIDNALIGEDSVRMASARLSSETRSDMLDRMIRPARAWRRRRPYPTRPREAAPEPLIARDKRQGYGFRTG